MKQAIKNSKHTQILDDAIIQGLRVPQTSCYLCAVNEGLNHELFGKTRAIVEISNIPHAVLVYIDDAGRLIVVDNSSYGNTLNNANQSYTTLAEYLENMILKSELPTIEELIEAHEYGMINDTQFREYLKALDKKFPNKPMVEIWQDIKSAIKRTAK